MGAAVLRTLSEVFGGDLPSHPLHWQQIAAHGALIYLAGLLLVRLGKSRLLSKATPLDVILAFILGSVLSRGINGSATLSGTVIAAATLIALHWVFTGLAFWSEWWGWIIKGETRILVSNGEINWPNMRRSHISEADLKEELRLQANIEDLASVQTAVKERNGDVGVIKKPTPEVRMDVLWRKGCKSCE